MSGVQKMEKSSWTGGICRLVPKHISGYLVYDELYDDFIYLMLIRNSNYFPCVDV